MHDAEMFLNVRCSRAIASVRAIPLRQVTPIMSRPLCRPAVLRVLCFAVWDHLGLIFLRRDRKYENQRVCHMLDDSVHHKVRSSRSTVVAVVCAVVACSGCVCVCVEGACVTGVLTAHEGSALKKSHKGADRPSSSLPPSTPSLRTTTIRLPSCQHSLRILSPVFFLRRRRVHPLSKENTTAGFCGFCFFKWPVGDLPRS